MFSGGKERNQWHELGERTFTNVFGEFLLSKSEFLMFSGGTEIKKISRKKIKKLENEP